MSATSYVTADEMRGELYPYIDVPSTGAGPVSDARLLAMGTAASRLVDTYCSDHFHATTGGTVRLEGNGRFTLPLPRRIRGVTSVALIDYAGDSTAVSDDYWRIETSLESVTGANVIPSPIGVDALTLKQPLVLGNQGGNWPTVPWIVSVIGDFDWATTPEEVKHATAMIVWEWAAGEVPPSVEQIDSATMRFTRPRSGADTTGVIAADLLLEPFRRTQFGRLMRA